MSKTREHFAFPTNNDEYERMLELFDVDPKEWVTPEFRRENVMGFLFLRALQEMAKDASPIIFTREAMESSRRRGRARDLEYDRPEVPVVEKILDAGVTASEISALVTQHCEGFLFRVLYFLGDPHHFGDEIGDELRFGLYAQDEDGQPIPGSAGAFRNLEQLWHYATPRGRKADGEDSV